MATNPPVIHPKFHHVNLMAGELGPEAAPLELPQVEA